MVRRIKVRSNPNNAAILSKVFLPDSFPDPWVIPAIMHITSYQAKCLNEVSSFDERRRKIGPSLEVEYTTYLLHSPRQNALLFRSGHTGMDAW
jgi:hypothetical protein